MEKKRLNENTIQVIIDQDDLDERGITMLDLLGNQKQIEDFFYSILSEVDTDHQFKKNDSVTFQALPIKDGLELIISKNANRQALSSDADNISKMIADQLRGHDTPTYNQSQGHKGEIQSLPELTNTFIVKFTDFEDFISLANVMDDDDLYSDLYLYKGAYYLIVHNAGDYTSDSTLDYQAMANEYGQIINDYPGIIEEHGKKLMSRSALDTARYYFK